MIADIIVVLLLVCICVGIGIYLIRERRRGVKCVGCPYAKECAKKSCTDHENQDK